MARRQNPRLGSFGRDNADATRNPLKKSMALSAVRGPTRRKESTLGAIPEPLNLRSLESTCTHLNG